MVIPSESLRGGRSRRHCAWIVAVIAWGLSLNIGPRNSHGILCECLMNGKSMHPQIVASITFASCSRPMFFVWFHMIQCPMENCNFQTNPISSMRKPGKLRQVTRASHHFPLPSPVHPGCCRAEKLRWPSPEWSRMVQNGPESLIFPQADGPLFRFSDFLAILMATYISIFETSWGAILNMWALGKPN